MRERVPDEVRGCGKKGPGADAKRRFAPGPPCGRGLCQAGTAFVIERTASPPPVRLVPELVFTSGQETKAFVYRDKRRGSINKKMQSIVFAVENRIRFGEKKEQKEVEIMQYAQNK